VAFGAAEDVVDLQSHLYSRIQMYGQSLAQYSRDLDSDESDYDGAEGPVTLQVLGISHGPRRNCDIPILQGNLRRDNQAGLPSNTKAVSTDGGERQNEEGQTLVQSVQS
jgi:hypothetical protein